MLQKLDPQEFARRRAEWWKQMLERYPALRDDGRRARPPTAEEMRDARRPPTWRENMDRLHPLIVEAAKKESQWFGALRDLGEESIDDTHETRWERGLVGSLWNRYAAEQAHWRSYLASARSFVAAHPGSIDRNMHEKCAHVVGRRQLCRQEDGTYSRPDMNEVEWQQQEARRRELEES